MSQHQESSNLGLRIKEAFSFEIKNDAFFGPTQSSSTGLFVCRQDGQLLGFELNSFKHLMPKDEHSIGALLAGLWQASEALLSFLPKMQGLDSFRLTFDTTETGLIIYPLKIQNRFYYLGILFSDVLNPGPLKNKGKQLSQRIEAKLNLEEKNLPKDTGPLNKKNNRPLFDNITDAEINNLFSGANL